MSAPLGVSVAFHDNALTVTPQWYRLDDTGAYPGLACTGWSIDRGRSSQLDKTKTGTATVTFRDTAGILDPTSASSPFNGYIVPQKRAAIALFNPCTSTWETLFTGYTSNYDYTFDQSEKFADVTIELVDLFDLLANIEMMPGHHGSTPPERFNQDQIYFAGEPTSYKHVDDRIKDALTAGSIPSAWWDIFSGNCTVQEKVYARRDALLTVLQDAADAEFPGVSNIYVSKNGYVSFRGRLARFNPTNPTYGLSTWPVGDMTAVDADGTRAVIADLQPQETESDIINACIALPYGVAETDVPGSLVTNSSSINAYGWRGASFPDLLMFKSHDSSGNPVDAVTATKNIATYFVDNYAFPKTRVPTLTFRAQPTSSHLAPNVWALLQGVEIGDRVQLKTNQPGAGGFDEYFFVEGIRYNADTAGGPFFTNVTMELDVSPASLYAINPFATTEGGP